MTERKVKRVRQYTYRMVKICNETDQVFTQCYKCGEWKPSTVENFRKEASPTRDRDIRPLCKECANEGHRNYLKNRQHQRELARMKEISKETVHNVPLINEEEEKVDLRSRLERFLDSLWL